MRGSSGLTVAVCVSVLLAVPMATALQPQEEWGDERAGEIPIPSRIGNLWVSAEMLISRNDGLLLAAHPMIDQRWNAELTAALENPPDACLEMGPGSYAEVSLPKSFSEAVTKAKAIMQGVVTGTTGGFYAGLHPGLLIQVRIQEWVERSPDYPDTPYTYFYHPVGDFQMGSIRICKDDPSWPEPPEVGDEVLLFPRWLPMGPDGVVTRVTMDGVEVVTGGPGGFRISSALSEIAEFREAVSIQELKRLMADVLREH
jgi:hypothetical protein